jgi:hypothetical protein
MNKSIAKLMDEYPSFEDDLTFKLREEEAM